MDVDGIARYFHSSRGPAVQENGLLDCLLSYDWTELPAPQLIPALAQHLADMVTWIDGWKTKKLELYSQVGDTRLLRFTKVVDNRISLGFQYALTALAVDI